MDKNGTQQCEKTGFEALGPKVEHFQKKKVHVHHSSMAKNLCSKFEHNRFTGFGKTGQNSTKTPVFEALGPKVELFQKKRFTKTILGWQRTYVPNLSTIGSVVSEKVFRTDRQPD